MTTWAALWISCEKNTRSTNGEVFQGPARHLPMTGQIAIETNPQGRAWKPLAVKPAPKLSTTPKHTASTQVWNLRHIQIQARKER